MRAAIYVRQSQDKSGEALAVGRQQDECQELCERNGWDVGQVYRDNDSSATTGKLRPEWAKLLVDLDAGRHDVLVCWHTDRLYRRLRDLVDLVEIAERRSLRIASVKAADIDLSTPAGRMLAGMLGHAARYEVEQKGARQVAANRARARNGVVLWSRRPFGFDRHGSDIHVVSSEAAEILKAAERVLAGDTLASIATDLNARGVSTSTGGPWSVVGLKRILLNPRIAGRVTYCGEDMGEGAPAIIDAEAAERLSGILRDPRRRTAHSVQVKHLLSGIVLCGRDGERMLATSGQSGKERVRYAAYRCRRCTLMRKTEPVDEVVVAAVVARLSRPDAAQLFGADEADVRAMRGHLVELRDRRDGLAALLADGLLTPESVREQASRLTAKMDQLNRDIDAATGESPVNEVLAQDDVEQSFRALPLVKQREVIRLLLDVVILPAGKGARFTPEQVEIRWKGSE
jgi:site-specific DNA recombinase